MRLYVDTQPKRLGSNLPLRPVDSLVSSSGGGSHGRGMIWTCQKASQKVCNVSPLPVRTLAEPLLMVNYVLSQAVESAREKATSVSHKNAYDRFLRRCSSKKHFRASLSGDPSESSAIFGLVHPVVSLSEEPRAITVGRRWSMVCSTSLGHSIADCLAGEILRDRNELFNIWLEAGEDFAKVEMHYERKRTRQDILNFWCGIRVARVSQ